MEYSRASSVSLSPFKIWLCYLLVFVSFTSLILPSYAYRPENILTFCLLRFVQKLTDYSIKAVLIFGVITHYFFPENQQETEILKT